MIITTVAAVTTPPKAKIRRAQSHSSTAETSGIVLLM